MNTVNVTFYAVVKATVQNGYLRGRAKVRVTVKRPAVGPDEVPVRIELSLPLTLFKRPTLTATIAVPAEAAPGFEIPVHVQEDMAKQLREQLGLDVRVQVEAP